MSARVTFVVPHGLDISRTGNRLVLDSSARAKSAGAKPDQSSEQSPGPGSAAPGATGQPGQSATGDGAKPGKPDPSPWPEPDVGLYEIVRHGSHAFDIDLKTLGKQYDSLHELMHVNALSHGVVYGSVRDFGEVTLNALKQSLDKAAPNLRFVVKVGFDRER
jgi:hypothetical protein